MFLPAGWTSDDTGARALLSSIPQAGARLADRGRDADRFHTALLEREISACLPARRGRKNPIPIPVPIAIPVPNDPLTPRSPVSATKQRPCSRLEDWRRSATRHDRCPIPFLSACALAATDIW